MKEDLIIKDFCVIRQNRVSTANKIIPFDEGPFGDFITAVYHHFQISYPKFYKMDNLSKLGFISAEILLNGKKWREKYSPDDIGLILADSSSSIDADRNHQNSIADKDNYFPGPAVFVYTLPNIMIGEISIRHKFTGEGTFFIQEKFDPASLHQYVNELFINDLVQCCITGWVEVNGNNYESALYFIEKDQMIEGMIIFDPSQMNKIYKEEKF